MARRFGDNPVRGYKVWKRDDEGNKVRAIRVHMVSRFDLFCIALLGIIIGLGLSELFP